MSLLTPAFLDRGDGLLSVLAMFSQMYEDRNFLPYVIFGSGPAGILLGVMNRHA